MAGCRIPMMIRRIQVFLSWLVFAGWVVGVTWLSALPASAFPRFRIPFAHFDKVVHWMIFFPGAMALLLALRVTWPQTKRRHLVVITFLLLSVFGVANEWQQLWTPGRTGGSWGDIAANTVGVASGCGLFLLLDQLWCRLRGLLRGLRSPADKPPPRDRSQAG